MELPEDAPALPEEHRTADERATLDEMLDFYRIVLVRKTWGLSTEDLHSAPLPSTLTLGRLLSHMAFVEDHWFHMTFAGHPAPDPWSGADFGIDPDWEMTWGEDRAHGQLAALFAESVERSRAAAHGAGLDAVGRGPQGEGVNLRWILVHMIEEYARHVGHADLLREAIDAQVGD
ncbi:MAG: DinB family protein [Acidimicrobiales bacterium]